MSVISKLVNYTIFHPYGRITAGHLHGEVYLCRLRWKEEEEMRKGNITEVFIIFCILEKYFQCVCVCIKTTAGKTIWH